MKTYKASYSAEASYIIAITMTIMAFLIRATLNLYQEGTGVMYLRYEVEKLAGKEDDSDSYFNIAGLNGMSKGNLHEAEGSISGDKWNTFVRSRYPEPEFRMRALTAIKDVKEGKNMNKKGEDYGDKLSQGYEKDLYDGGDG